MDAVERKLDYYCIWCWKFGVKNAYARYALHPVYVHRHNFHKYKHTNSIHSTNTVSNAVPTLAHTTPNRVFIIDCVTVDISANSSIKTHLLISTTMQSKWIQMKRRCTKYSQLGRERASELELVHEWVCDSWQKCKRDKCSIQASVRNHKHTDTKCTHALVVHSNTHESHVRTITELLMENIQSTEYIFFSRKHSYARRRCVFDVSFRWLLLFLRVYRYKFFVCVHFGFFYFFGSQLP